jgi:hypothetical protein
VCEAAAAAVRLQTLSETCNLLLVFQTQPRSAKLGHYRTLSRSEPAKRIRVNLCNLRPANLQRYQILPQQLFVTVDDQQVIPAGCAPTGGHRAIHSDD